MNTDIKINMSKIITIHTDGASRGNPGHASAAFVVIDEKNKTIFEYSKYLGIKTNNEAEYAAALLAHNWLQTNINELTGDEIQFKFDSELITRQLNGQIKSPSLLPIAKKILEIKKELSIPISYQHVRREHNALADKLANKAIDKEIK